MLFYFLNCVPQQIAHCKLKTTKKPFYHFLITASKRKDSKQIRGQLWGVKSRDGLRIFKRLSCALNFHLVGNSCLYPSATAAACRIFSWTLLHPIPSLFLPSAWSTWTTSRKREFRWTPALVMKFLQATHSQWRTHTQENTKQHTFVHIHKETDSHIYFLSTCPLKKQLARKKQVFAEPTYWPKWAFASTHALSKWRKIVHGSIILLHLSNAKLIFCCVTCEATALMVKKKFIPSLSIKTCHDSIHWENEFLDSTITFLY